jgi:SAM-dependent methyltransferase
VAQSSSWYDAHAPDLVHRYELIDPATMYGWLSGLLSDATGTVLDVGAGSGRDAAWFAARGHDVVAVEPTSAMRSEGQHRHPDPRVRWLDDQLPELSQTGHLGITFDVVLLSAVWQHVAPTHRERAFRKLTQLVKSGGLLVLSLRSGPSPLESRMYPVSLEEVERLARNHGFSVEKVHQAADQQGRPDVSWTWVALRLPDDGTGALPLLRHVILNDQKSATYKLGLLRALCRAADGSAGLVDDTDEDFVRVPLGLVALNWLRLYLPLVREGLPQTPTNIGAEGLGFAKEGFKQLLADTSAADLRIGAAFSTDRAKAVHAAIREAAQTIDRMPSTFMTYPMGGRILPVERGRAGLAPVTLTLGADYMRAFGWMRVPTHLWRAMRRNAAWIEPTLVSEWARLMRDYAVAQDRQLAEETVIRSMQWADPERDVSQARQVAISILEHTGLRCVWTDQPLNRQTLDIDHMFPWAAWPCSDLWNLLPAHRHVNQRLKRDRLPSASTMSRGEASITNWWEQAYLRRAETPLPAQFMQEARASLPGFSTGSSDNVFSAVCLQRIRLHHDQQVPEWEWKP